MNNKKLLLLATILLLCRIGLAQESFTIRGHVRNAENGEELISADIYAKKLTIGTITNLYGFYSLTLPRGNYSLKYSYMGCLSKSISVNLNENKELDVDLLSSSFEIEEIVVLAEDADENIKESEKKVAKPLRQEARLTPVKIGKQHVNKQIKQ